MGALLRRSPCAHLFLSMYGFSMLTSTGLRAMVIGVFARGRHAGAPAMLMVALLAYFSNLLRLPNQLFFRAGCDLFISDMLMGRWFKIGFIVSSSLGRVVGCRVTYWKSLVGGRLQGGRKH